MCSKTEKPTSLISSLLLARLTPESTEEEKRAAYKALAERLRQIEDEEEEEPVNYEKCKGCPNPADGSKGHKFSCFVAGVRASQVILPATISPDGRVSVTKNTKDE